MIEDLSPAASYLVRETVPAKHFIKKALFALNLPICGSYTVLEARSILGIGHNTFRRLIRQFELDGDGRLVRPHCIRTILLGKHRRVPFLELVEFVKRNDGYLLDNMQEKTI